MIKHERSFFQAKLIDYDKINLVVFTSVTKTKDNYVFLVKDFLPVAKLTPSKTHSMNDISFYEFHLNHKIELGHLYELYIPDFGSAPVDVTDAIYFDDFDKEFGYDGDDLGSTYYPDHTDFVVWAPLASNVSVLLYYENNNIIRKMKREEKGIYRIRVEGDLKNIPYQYVVTNSGVSREVNDPYSKGTTDNSRYSVVIDINELNKIEKINSNLNKSILDSTIYELNVRDFTIDENSDIENKGKYLGLIEPNRKTRGGNPAGLDYLKYLGITHIQLQPLLDFANVDDLNASKSYNWGYDVISFFNLEGSYSNNPKDPITRLMEVKKMIAELHRNNIGVNLDVVYNHIYSYEFSAFEKIVPNYFFRKQKGHMCNGSGCGNDIASERFMVRKMIVDSLKYLTETFDFDGYRFDLMGLIDIKTMEEIKKELDKIKDNVFLYGEGWGIPTGIDYQEQASIMNAFKTPFLSYFNDSYRDILKGSTFDMAAKGYIGGDSSYLDGMIYASMGCAKEYTYPPRFISASQSINYVECHDNSTLYDKLEYSNGNEDEEIKLSRIKLANALIGFNFGVPFYHMGQEIGQSKNGEDNTYNMGDKYNKMQYDLVDKRFDMVRQFKDILKVRKELGIFNLNSGKDIFNALDFEKFEDGILVVKYLLPHDKFENIIMVTNPSDHTFNLTLPDYYILYFANAGAIYDKKKYKFINPIIAPRSTSVFVKEK